MNVNVPEIVSTASKALKNRTLGGVTNESAMAAIEKGVKEAVKHGEEALSKAVKEGAEALGQVKKELQAFKNKTAQEMAELTSQKDEIILQTKQQAKKEARKVKVFEKVLPNGNKEVRKVNKNGAVMVKEVTADGKKNVKVQVTTLEGDYRKTTYDAQTGRPLKTFTNINDDQLIEYSNKGTVVKNVNQKKLKSIKPQVQSTKIVNESYDSAQIRKTYTDGSYEDIVYSKRYQTDMGKRAFNAENKLVSAMEVKAYASNGKPLKTTFFYNPENGNLIKYIDEQSNTVKHFNDRGEIVELVKSRDGMKRIMKSQINEYGMVNSKNPSLKYIYPKSSKIKTSEIEFESEFHPTKEVLKMRDGSTAVLSRIDGNYKPHKLEIIPRGQTSGEILENEDLIKWCNENGKVMYSSYNERFANEYYYNTFL